MAAKKRAEKKVAKGSAKSAKAGASASSRTKKVPAGQKTGKPKPKMAAKKPSPKKAAPQKAAAKKATKAANSGKKAAPKAKPVPVKNGPVKKAPLLVAKKANAPKLVKEPAAKPGAAKPAAAKPGAAKPSAAKPSVAPAKPTATKSGATPAPSPSKSGLQKPGAARLAIPPPPNNGKNGISAASTKGLTKPGALGTGPVRLIPASSPSGRGLGASAPKSSVPPTKAGKQGVTLVRRPTDRPSPATLPAPVLPIPVRPLAAPMTVEERSASIEKRLAAQSDDFRKRYIDSFDMSWIYHDSALEGVVYTLEELKTGLTNIEAAQVPDSSLQPAADEIRRHKEAIEYVRDFGTKKRLPVTIDVIKKIYLILHPSEGDLKTVKYRKDIPQHRLYFHEYTAPDKIGYKVRQIVDWLNEPETKKTRNSLRIAARAHYDLLRVFPFQTDSGKVARLFMNLLLMRAGYPPSIIHSTERQRYYDALKGSANIVLAMVQESVENALSSVEKLLDEHETKTRAFVN